MLLWRLWRPCSSLHFQISSSWRPNLLATGVIVGLLRFMSNGVRLACFWIGAVDLCLVVVRLWF